MPNPVLTPTAFLIDNFGTPTLSDGAQNESLSQDLTGSNSAFLSGSNLYAVVANQAGTLAVLQSDLTGETWVPFGVTAAQTENGGAMVATLDPDGVTLHVGYCGPVQTHEFYYRTFAIDSVSWSAEHHGTFAGPGDEFILAPYQIHVRPDGSVVFLGNYSAGEVHVFALVWSGGAFLPLIDFPSGGINQVWLTSTMRADGTIDSFAGLLSGGFTTPYHQVLAPDNTVGAVQEITGIAQVLDWNEAGVENGFYDDASSTFFLAAGVETAAFPVIFGRPVILSGNDGAWTLTPEIDTTLDADYSVYDGHLVSMAPFVVYVSRVIDSAGSNYLIRVGYALAADFADPAAWTWVTAYDMSAPSPLVPGEAAPYSPVTFKGPNSGLAVGSDNVARYATTLTGGGGQFITLLLTVAGSVVPPPPSGPRPVAPGAGGGGFRPSTCGCSPELLAAEELRRRLGRLRAWPYSHIFPPADAVPVQVCDSVAVGALSSEHTLIEYTVPHGFRFFLHAIMLDYTGGVFVPGDALWTVNVNAPDGSATVQSAAVQGLQSIEVPLGSLANGQLWPFWSPYNFASLDVVRTHVVNENLNTGFFTSVLVGYLLRAIPRGVI